MKVITPYLAFLLAFTACQPKESSIKAVVLIKDTSINKANAFSGLFFDSTAMENYLGTTQMHDTARILFRNFYGLRNFQYAWFDSSGIAEQAQNFWNLQENFLAYSGDSSIFNPFLQIWIDSVRNNGPKIVPDSLRQKVEWTLSLQFFRYAAKAYYGNRKLDARQLDWFIPRKKVNITALLDTLIKDKGKSINSYEPVNNQYKLLREQLQRYDAIRKQGGWTPLSPRQKKYSEGDNIVDIRQIKHRLYMTGDLKTDDTSSVFTADLSKAVKNFQNRYGLKEDGAVGGVTLSEMNRPIEFLIRKILVNMERVRWLPVQPDSDFILVNIPSFRLFVFEKGKQTFKMNVVVGSTQNNTVIFTGKLKHVVFSPYWNVPPSIIKKEVVPGIKRNPNYLATHNMEWNGGNVRQKPGLKNSLGLVKFLFPNSYNIYLHDTPSKSLFNENKRAFSHGCIRLSEPKKLAQWILRNEKVWTDEAIVKAMNGGKEKYVNVKQDVQVFIGYFTAFVDGNGNMNFRDDIYGHDKKMAEKMFGE